MMNNCSTTKTIHISMAGRQTFVRKYDKLPAAWRYEPTKTVMYVWGSPC